MRRIEFRYGEHVEGVKENIFLHPLNMFSVSEVIEKIWRSVNIFSDQKICYLIIISRLICVLPPYHDLKLGINRRSL